MLIRMKIAGALAVAMLGICAPAFADCCGSSGDNCQAGVMSGSPTCGFTSSDGGDIAARGDWSVRIIRGGRTIVYRGSSQAVTTRLVGVIQPGDAVSAEAGTGPFRIGDVSVGYGQGSCTV